MFIKKDTRKVPEILTDENDERKQLLLARRGNEFKNQSASLLFQEKYFSSFKNLQVLSLYGNKLNDLAGIASALKDSPITDLNLGRNEFTDLPEELSQLKTIKNVWIDDNKLTLIPNCIYDMDNLENLRLSGNKITVIDDKVQNLLQLETFVIDGNKLTNLPDALTKLANLKILNVRGNLLKSIPKKINAMSSLESLHISSNQIKNLPSNFDGMEFFKELYAGSNEIENVPSSLALLESITFISLVNNNISELNEIVYQQWFDQENSKPKEFIHLKGNKVIRGSRSLSQQTPSPYFSANGKTITESAKKKKRRENNHQ